MKLIMLKGLPGSGKSTWAKQLSRNNQQYTRVNKDEIRAMIGYTPSRENLVLKMRDAFIQAAIKTKNVIVDDTNFHPKHEKRLRELAAENGAEFEEKFFDTPLSECIKNDLSRPNSVGEKVIKKMWREFLKPPQFVPNPVWGGARAIIVDIDGTLAIHAGRNPYDMDRCDTDILNQTIAGLVRRYPECKVLIVSGREDKYRDMTNHWFDRHEFFRDELFMRPTGDHREDSIIKQEIYDREIKDKYNVEFVLDDRNRVVDMWRRNGLICLQVAEGDF